MQLSRYDDVRQFHARVEPFLLAHEAAHCLPLGILNTLLQQPDTWGSEPPYLALLEDEGAVVSVALRTPPYNPILSLIAPEEAVDEALALLASDLRACYGSLPGVLGASTLSQAFAGRWRELTGRSFRLSVKERIYQLDAVIPVTGVAGQMRRATEADRALLERWIAAFHDEALGDREPLDAQRWVENALTTATRVVYLWEDGGRPVSLAGYGGPTPNGMRIGPVYTPPEHRGHGYARAVTAALSQLLLDSGRRYCFLFTDLANPTSNAIYQVIGYRPVVDVDMYAFADA